MDLGLMELFVVKDRTGKVLDVLDDTILTLHSSVEHGQELRMGTLVDEDMDPTTTTTTTTSTTTTTTTVTTVTSAAATLPTTTTDPCQEVLDIIKQKDEIIRNLTQHHGLEADEQGTETTTVSGVDTQATDGAEGTTSLYPLVIDTTTVVMDLITSTMRPGDLDYVDPAEESAPESLRGVKMITRTKLSYNPVKGVTSETEHHSVHHHEHPEKKYQHRDFTTIKYSSAQCEANSEYL